MRNSNLEVSLIKDKIPGEGIEVKCNKGYIFKNIPSKSMNVTCVEREAVAYWFTAAGEINPDSDRCELGKIASWFLNN